MQSKTRQSPAHQSKAMQSKAMQNQAKQSKAEASKAMQSNAKQCRAKQSNVKRSNAKQSKAMQSKAKQGKAKQCKAKQAKQIRPKRSNARPGKYKTRNAFKNVPQLGMPLGWLRGSYCVPSIPVVCAGQQTPRVPWRNRVLLKRLLHFSREFVISEIGILSRVPGLWAGLLGPPEPGSWAPNPQIQFVFGILEVSWSPWN